MTLISTVPFPVDCKPKNQFFEAYEVSGYVSVDNDLWSKLDY